MTELAVGSVVFCPLLNEFVEIVAKQEYLDEGEVALVVETSEGELYEISGYEVGT